MARVSNYSARPLIERRRDFKTHSDNFRGETHKPGDYVFTGRLSGKHSETLSQADYIVFSYATPIAWHLPDGWVVPPVTYSVSTARHQSIARAAARGEWSAHHQHPGWVLGLTRAQSEALDRLREGRKLWPISGRGGDRGDYSRRTLQAVVDKGLARWVTRDGVMPYIESTEGE